MEGNSYTFVAYRVAALVLLTLLLIGESECLCSRTYTSNEPDCSTVMQCFVKSSDGQFQQLEYPGFNEQLCYRTCIDSDSDTCEATLVSNRSISIVRRYGSTYQLSVHSQGFHRYGNRRYRKSSICRYQVQCDEDKLLSYQIHNHILEEPATCYNTETCVDSLKIQHRGLAGMETTCGTLNDHTLHSDGSRNLLVEFQSNRKNEFTGFQIMVYCVAPGTTERNTRSAESNHTGTGTGTCTSPKAMWKRDTHETTTDPALKLAAAFPSHNEKILAPSSIRITVDVYGHVNYTNNTIVISQPGGKLREFSGVTSFHLSNRIVNDKIFKFSAPDRYHGYGYIVLWKWQAFFLQDGINPEYRPTDEEQTIIMQLQTGLKAELTKDLDTQGNERSSQDLPNDHTKEWPKETASLVDTARHYSIACNALLRSVACAYLKVVADEDCEESSSTAHILG